jgi:cell wall-associated NlpC family hydrolase
LIHEIHSALSEVLRERSLDWRTCFTEVRAEPPEGRRIVIESSDADVLSEVGRRVSPLAAGAGMTIELVGLPQHTGVVPEVLIASGSVADVRRTPSHASELVTQLVCGDAVDPLKTAGEWVLVRLDDPYIGWVRSWHLKGVRRSEQDAFLSAARHRVSDNVVQLREEPDDGALAVGEAVVGTPVVAEAAPRRGWRQVTLPDGAAGYLRARSVEKRGVPLEPSREGLVASALRFLGVPYVWGGTTPKGFDCSGLVQRAFRLNGIKLPRDSDQQAAFGREKSAGSPGELQTADLLFFGKSVKQITHVAVYTTEGFFVHARGFVRINSLFPGDPLFDEKLVQEWRTTRDPLSS